MKFLRKIKETLRLDRRPSALSPHEKAPISDDLDAVREEQRLHERFLLPFSGLASLELASNLIGSVKDISYGGLAAEFKTPHSNALQKTKYEATLTLLDQSIRCHLHLARSIETQSGLTLGAFEMHHDTPAALLFLRDFIEPWRQGRLATLIPFSFRQEHFKTPEWQCFRSDGSFHILLKSNPHNTLSEALITLRRQESYIEVRFKDGVISTGLSLQQEDSGLVSMGSQMAPTENLDHAALRQAICSLMGTPLECRRLSAPISQEALRLLGLTNLKAA